MKEKQYTFEDFCEIIRRLRAPDGCPWDRAQTHESLKPCMLEEAAEAAAAIRIYEHTGDDGNLKEELGDVLMQVVMHAQIAREEGRFDINDVIGEISRKMIRRHPHVFGTEEEKKNPPDWEAIKKREKEQKAGQALPEELPKEFSALMRAQKMYKKYQKQENIVIREPERIPDRVRTCLEAARDTEDPKEAGRQIGQALLYIAGMAQILGISAETALGDAVDWKSLKNT